MLCLIVRVISDEKATIMSSERISNFADAIVIVMADHIVAKNASSSNYAEAYVVRLKRGKDTLPIDVPIRM